MGKINPAKLSNFTEVDLYVMVACPETSLVRLMTRVPLIQASVRVRSRVGFRVMVRVS